MTYNIQSWTSDGFLQLDGLYSSYALIAQGVHNVPLPASGTLGTTAYNKRGPDLTYPDYGQIPLIAIGNTSGVGVVVSHVTSSSARFYLRQAGKDWGVGYGGGISYATGTGSINLPYRVYTPVKVVTPSTDSYGLRIYDGNSALIYDSGLPTLVTLYFANVAITNGAYTPRLNTTANRVRPVGNYVAEPTGYDPPATLYSDIGQNISVASNNFYVVISDAQGTEEATLIGFYEPSFSGYVALLNPKYVVDTATGTFSVDMGIDPWGYWPSGYSPSYEKSYFRDNVKLKRWAIRG